MKRNLFINRVIVKMGEIGRIAYLNVTKFPRLKSPDHSKQKNILFWKNKSRLTEFMARKYTFRTKTT